MSLPESLLRSIADTAEQAGGTLADAQDLADVWELVHVDLGRRAARMRYEAARRRCYCVDGGEPAPNGRCGRCCGVLR